VCVRERERDHSYPLPATDDSPRARAALKTLLYSAKSGVVNGAKRGAIDVSRLTSMAKGLQSYTSSTASASATASSAAAAEELLSLILTEVKRTDLSITCIEGLPRCVYIYIHACMHTYIHTYMYIYIHLYIINIYIYIYISPTPARPRRLRLQRRRRLPQRNCYRSY